MPATVGAGAPRLRSCPRLASHHLRGSTMNEERVTSRRALLKAGGSAVGLAAVGGVTMGAGVVASKETKIHFKNEEFYDMEEDPLQAADLSRQGAPLAEFREAVGTRRHYRPTAPPVVRDKALEEKLRSMGYLQ